MMTPRDSAATSTEIAPTYIVPMPIIGVIVFFATLFGGIFGILPFVVSDDSVALEIGSVAGVMVLFLAWLGFFRAWRTRRKSSKCRLVLEGGSVTAGKPCLFRIDDRGDYLDPQSEPRFALSYRDQFRRVEGHKVYRHGPYLLDVEVGSTFTPGARPFSVRGWFSLNPGQVKPDPPNEHWETETFLILAMSQPSGRRCTFELPYVGESIATEAD
jgi:hypothetical protein